MIHSEKRSKTYLQLSKMNLYNILVDGHVVAENVTKCDLQHKIEMVRAACNLEYDLRFSKVTHELINNPETIAWIDLWW